MKYLICMFFQVVIVITTYAQDSSVYQPLNDYIIGTTYSSQPQILNAFTDDAILYLTNKDGSPNHISPVEYANYFKPEKKGRHTGRVGKILSVKQYNDIAVAEVQILVPKWSLDFMDIILLKRINEEWKIISKTATKRICEEEQCGYSAEEIEALLQKVCLTNK